MKSIINIFIVFFVASLLWGKAFAKTTTAKVGTGNWGTAATWDNGVPGEGDIIIIPNGAIVTVEAGTSYNFIGTGTTTITIQSGGELNGGGFAGFAYSTIHIDSGDADLITVETGGVINPELAINFDGGLGGIFSEVIISTILPSFIFPGVSTTVPGPSLIENGALPITLIEFNAKSELGFVNLTWATASEENFDYFSIERSVDGENFKEIAQIQGMGDSFERVDYEFTDDLPLEGISYYRLRSIDFDGYTEIFDYVMVEVEGVSSDFSVYPNPIQNGQFSLQTNFVEDAELIIYNNVGKVEEHLNVNDWLSDYNLNLQPGSYLFKLVTNDGVIVKRVLVK